MAASRLSSTHPLGTRLRTPVYKIDSTSTPIFENEDDDEYEYDYGLILRRFTGLKTC